jgi:nucleoside-diphosphate-sugar epimerase
MRILIIGGTRNIGLGLSQQLVEAGHQLTLFNRGRTPDPLPENIERLHGDRTDPLQLQAALAGRDFDIAIDTTLYKGPEAETVVKLLNGHVGHYIFLSSGQVYLVREGVERPFREEDYEGRLMPAPKVGTYGYEEWLYGMDKRKAEDVFIAAGERYGFPYTTLRLPMVNSERDHFNRLYGYILRLKDGGPVLVPETPDYNLRHIYGSDVVRAIMLLVNSGQGKGRAFNISQDETVSLDEFLSILGDILDIQPTIVRFKRSQLEGNGFLPDCSPFSERWMSELSNERSKAELGMRYTPLREYLTKLVEYYEANPPPRPVGYRRRHAELDFAMHTER